MKAPVLLAGALATALLVPACGGCDGDGGAVTPDAAVDAAVTPVSCDDTFDAFTRHAMLALAGRRPVSQAEVDVYVDLAEAVEAEAGAAADGSAGRAAIADAIMAGPGYADRWVEQLMDTLKVQRLDIQSQAACWGDARRASVTPALAASVRDADALGGDADGGAFTMLDLARSSVALDDVTPILRGQVFAMMALPIPAANVPPVEAELARRADFGATFDSAYLRRDMVCLGCHNSEASITDSDDPAYDRHWPVDGWPEQALYGTSSGIDPDRAHAAFRVDGFVGFGTAAPWGWDNACGSFTNPRTISSDPADIDGKLGSLTGKKLTVFDLDGALRAGFEALRGMPPDVTAIDGTFADPDAALAWLVALSVVESVWREVVGHPLTIANYFPRNGAARDVLRDLTRGFVTDGFSLRKLLVAIVESDYFAQQAPDAGCGDGPYALPAIYDPWVIADDDAERRGNGPGDAIAPLSARTLLTASEAALAWPPPTDQRFPADSGGFCVGSCDDLNFYCSNFGSCCVEADAVCAGQPIPAGEADFQRGVGTFLRNGERGFRGLDFQARLTWEQRVGACESPTAAPDFVTELIAAADADNTATVRDVVAALKDRLIGEPTIDEAGGEGAALAALLGATLDAPGASLDEGKLRQLCGTLLSTPQFLLQGVAGRGGALPRLTPAEAQYAAVCADLAGRDLTDLAVTCDGTSLTISRP